VATTGEKATKRVLAIDIGGTNVKILATGETERRTYPSGKHLTPEQMVEAVTALAKSWTYDVISIGYPGAVLNGRPVVEPHNLGSGWVGFDFERAFGCPVKVINDAAMQALGSHERGTSMFLGLGTGLGTALVVNGTVVPMELGHLSWRKGTFEGYLGLRGLKEYGKKTWRKNVARVAEKLISVMFLDEVVLGGGNAKKLKTLPPGCRLGDNANAFTGGFRLWKD